MLHLENTFKLPFLFVVSVQTGEGSPASLRSPLAPGPSSTSVGDVSSPCCQPDTASWSHTNAKMLHRGAVRGPDLGGRQEKVAWWGEYFVV